MPTTCEPAQIIGKMNACLQSTARSDVDDLFAKVTHVMLDEAQDLDQSRFDVLQTSGSWKCPFACGLLANL